MIRSGRISPHTHYFPVDGEEMRPGRIGQHIRPLPLIVPFKIVDAERSFREENQFPGWGQKESVDIIVTVIVPTDFNDEFGLLLNPRPWRFLRFRYGEDQENHHTENDFEKNIENVKFWITLPLAHLPPTKAAI